MSDFQTSSRRRVAAAVIVLAGLLTACLGQDFLNAPLELDGLDHGWLVNVEPAEEFAVDLVAKPLHPDRIDLGNLHLHEVGALGLEGR